MRYEGVLVKMKTENSRPVTYFMDLGDDFLIVNSLINKKLNIVFTRYQCLNCGRENKIFRQGFCYNCFYKTPLAGQWIIHPELSKAHLGIEDRDIAYEQQMQLQPHAVYLAVTGNLKTGVTRKQQLPTRWIDQGAARALSIAEFPNRYLAGITEKALKKHVSDKTNWRNMLLDNVPEIDLEAEAKRLKPYFPEEVVPYDTLSKPEVQYFDFPVTQYPEKLKTLNLEKTFTYEGILKGIKGQYLIFEDQTVFNVRKHEGFVVRIDIR